MRIKALISFAGSISMYAGEKRECNDKVILSDLLKAGYVEEIEVAKVNEDKEEKLEKSDKDESKRNKSK